MDKFCLSVDHYESSVKPNIIKSWEIFHAPLSSAEIK